MKKIFTLLLSAVFTMSLFAANDGLPGQFSAGVSNKVAFSKGNLQAKTTDNGANWTWGFAEHQWDLVGNAAANNAISGNGTVSANGTVDLFGWSTDATYYGINNSTNKDDYSGDFKDWGETIGDGWYTLKTAELKYLFDSRIGDKASTVDGNSDIRYAKATVNSINGIILFPDGGSFAASEFTVVGSLNTTDANFSTTICSATQWTNLEAKGCVFFPAAGGRSGAGVGNANSSGSYWTATPYTEVANNAVYMRFSATNFVKQDYTGRKDGLSVRLVKKVPQVYDTIAYTYQGNTLYYKITQKNALANKVNVINDGVHQPSGAVVIPDEITDFQGTTYQVDGIWSSAFMGNTAITSLDFSENTHITNTSSSMCDGCTNLTSVILSDYITKIFGYSFRECPLSSIDLKNVQRIEMSNFESATFTTVHIPASLDSIEDQSYLCYHATTVTCAAENTHFAAVDNVLYNKDLTKVFALPGGYAAEQEVHIVPTATSMAFSAFRGFYGKLYINSEITCKDHGWRNSPNGAVIVGCGLHDYYTTNAYAGAASGSGDFGSITSLTEKLLWDIDVVATNATVKLDTTDCNKVEVTVTANDGFTFVNWDNGETANPLILTVTSDTTVTANIKKNLVVDDTFFAPTVEGVNVTYKILAKEPGKMEVQIGNGNTQAISTSQTGNITIPEKVAYYDEEYDVVEGGALAFKLCAIDTLRLPNTILRLGRQFAYESQLKYVNIPDQLETLPTFGFAYLHQLKEITIPATVKYVGYGAFSFDNQLATINGWDPSKYERVGTNVFANATIQYNALTNENGLLYSDDIALAGNGAAQGRVIAFKEGTRIIATQINSVDACEKVIIPASVEAMTSHIFSGTTILDTIVVEALTPPMIYYGINNNTGYNLMTDMKASDLCDNGVPNKDILKFMVPKAALADYKASDTWKMVDLRPIEGWTITFKGHDGVIEEQQVQQDKMPVEPVVAPYNEGGKKYVFDHWDVAPVAAIEDATYEAVYKEDTALGLENRETTKTVKVIREGQLFILRDGKMYNALGEQVK